MSLENENQELSEAIIKLPRKGTKVRKCLEILVEAKGECVGIWNIGQQCRSTCAHNLVNDIAKKYGGVTNNTLWREKGILHSCHCLENWEDFKPLLEAAAA